MADLQFSKWKYEAQRPCELDLAAGEVVRVLERAESGWWMAEAGDGRRGEVPSTFLGEVADGGVDGGGDETVDAQDEEYFAEYGSNTNVHHQMLKDEPRCATYLKAMERHADRIRGKVVMDVGAGTGILSMYAARLGARRVYAIEASDMANGRLQEIVRRNGFEAVIRVIHARAEDVEALPAGEGEEEDATSACVDCLVSEWMGTCLVFESMAPAVLHARDRWLRPGGLMLPQRASLYAQPVDASALWAERVSFWADVHGFDMTPMLPAELASSFSSPVLTHPVAPQDVIAPAALVYGPVDLSRASVAEVTMAGGVERVFGLTARKGGAVHGIVVYFDVDFGDGVVLSTAPEAPATHWKHPLLVLDAPVPVSEGGAVEVRFRMAQNAIYARHYRIGVAVDGTPEKEFRLWM